MFYYECGTCHGLCDPGELENGVCYECRSKEADEQDHKSCQTLWKIAQQADGQLVMGNAAN